MTELFHAADPLDRRELLKGVAAAGIAAGLASLNEARAVSPETTREVIEGYTDQLSYRAGDRIGLHVSSSGLKFSVEIARIGARREVVWTKEGLPGIRHSIPENASTHGCRWPAALELRVPKDWKSG